jgi:hypothetical protein
MVEIPGTVSQILWHFTGGPTWNEVEKRQNVAPKSAADAYRALNGILRSRELRLGSFKEVVRVLIPEVRRRDPKTKKVNIERDVMRTLKSCPVCCLADIPIMHLSYHAARYGKFAIGFHRDAAIRAGFNPVFYTLHHSSVIRSIRTGFTKMRTVDLEAARALLADIQQEVESKDVEYEVGYYASQLGGEFDDIHRAVMTTKASIEQFLAFIKTFETDEFQTVYCEREWRAVTPFTFSYEDVAMIVVPLKVGENVYFERFVSSQAKRYKLPRSIPIVPWETLLES